MLRSLCCGAAAALFSIAVLAHEIIVPATHLCTYSYELAPNFVLLDSTDSDTVRTVSVPGGGRVETWVGLFVLPTSVVDCEAWSLELDADPLFVGGGIVLLQCFPQTQSEFALTGAFDWWLQVSMSDDCIGGGCGFADTSNAGYRAWLLERDHDDATCMVVLVRTITGQAFVVESLRMVWTVGASSVGPQPDRARNHIRIYPNPARDWIATDQPASLQIFDILGRRVCAGDSPMRLNLPVGAYWVQIAGRPAGESTRLTILK